MNEIPIIDEFEESEFNNCLEEEEIELTFIIDYNEGKLVHNFKDWSFLKKFNKLKVLKLNNAEIKVKYSNNFFLLFTAFSNPTEECLSFLNCFMCFERVSIFSVSSTICISEDPVSLL